MDADSDTDAALRMGDAIAAGVKQAHAETAVRLREGMDGVQLARRLTEDIERVAISFVNQTLAAFGFAAGGGLAVVATGGFGRYEFAPHSDLDLVFLCRDEPGPAVERLAHVLLPAFWHARLEPGHAVRSVREALELPASDLTAATAMLEARFLGGDAQVLEGFLEQYNTRVSTVKPEGLIPRLRAEQEARHSKFGDTIYLLEPDIKSGPGGLRDMCAGRWAARARFGTGSVLTLADRKQMSRRQAESFEAARSWLLRTRVAAHLASGRKMDHLRFDIQEKIAPVLYPDVRDAAGRDRGAVAPAVEALMGDYQVHARTIRRETERLLDRASRDPDRDPTSIQIVLESARDSRQAEGAVDGTFVLREGALEVMAPSLFEARPSEMVRVFAAAIELDAQVGLQTTDALMDLCADRPEAVRGDPESAAWFRQILVDVRDRARVSRLEQMQDVGLLEALMPEWGPVTGQVQYDTYHVYTVDQHSLYSVAMCKALARGEHRDEHNLAVEQMARIERRLPLFFAMLVHDVGKPLGPRHPETGAKLGREMARRMGLSDEDAGRVELLVREHLTMGLVSQRRDLADPATTRMIADLVVDEETLRQLYVVTFSDLYCVGPGNLTSFKEGLLRELFLRALNYVAHGPDSVAASMIERVDERRAQARAALAEKDGRAENDPLLGALFESLPNRYFIENNVSRIVSHVRMVEGRKGPCAVEFVAQARKGYTEMTLVADDVPGLLATVTGVLYANRIDILDAAIYSRTRPDGSFEALDVFRIRRQGFDEQVDEDRQDAIRKDLIATLSGSKDVKALIAARPRASGVFDRVKPKVPPTEVKLTNDFSPDFTIIDVFTEDQPGVLYTIADVLFRKGLDIRRSKVGVEADRVADVFYVLDGSNGQKLTDAERIEDLRTTLKAELAKRSGRA